MSRHHWGLTNLQLPTSDVDATPLVSMQFNAEWSEVLLSIASLLEDPETWEEGIDTDRSEQQAFTLYNLIRNAGAPMSYPQHASLWHDESTVLTGTDFTSLSLAPAPNNIPGQFYNLITYQPSNANGDSFQQSFTLDAGDYVFHVLGGQNQYGGLTDWYLDDDLTPFETGMDWYNSAVQINVHKVASVTIATAGQHVLKGVVNGTSSPSGLHFVPLVKYWFERVL